MKFWFDRRAQKNSKAARKRRRHFEELEARQLLAGDLYVEDRLVVTFAGNVSVADQTAALADVGATPVKTFRQLSNVVVAQLSSGANEDTVAAQLQSNPLVRTAERDAMRYFSATPNDPLYPLQYGLNNTGQAPLGGTLDADIDAAEAWDIFTGTSNSIAVVFDSGIDYNHPDLIDNLWVNTLEIPGDGEDNDGNGVIDDLHGFNAVTGTGDPLDTVGHGTHVAGILGAVGNNGVGGSGVNWDVQIMAVRIGGNSIATADFLAGVDYVLTLIARGENVVSANGSFGGPAFSQAEKDAIERLNNAGVLFAASAGNSTANNDIVANFPSGYNLPGIISVGASDKDDQQAVFSNFGKTSVDLHAPGEEIVSTIPTYLPQALGYPIGYDAFDGTSMASPMVAGAITLIKGLDSTLSAVQVKDIILSSVDIIPGLEDQNQTSGRLNILRALEKLPAGAIRGTVWLDNNGDGTRQFDEPGIGGFRVYNDLNNNGVLDGGEPNTTSLPNGVYNLPHFLGPGSFIIRQEVQPGYQITFPGSGAHTVTVGAFGQTISGRDFGNREVRGTVSGQKFIDANGDGVFDPGERPGVGFFIYLDLNQNGRAEFSEPSAITGIDGRYSLELPGSGSYVLREQVPAGWTQTLPANGAPYTFFAGITQSLSDMNFGNTGQLNDFGSAPFPYSNDVPHGILPGFQLGANLAGEAVPGSDTTDNDGVVFNTTMFAGSTATATVDIRLNGHSPGFLNGWIDFDQDGVFEPSEKIVGPYRNVEGQHAITFAVPSTALTGTTQARFRYSWARELDPNSGPASAGEAEDYLVTVFGTDPVANPDNVTVAQDAQDVMIDVLANDFPSSTPPIRVQSVDTQTQAGGAAVVAPNGLSVIYDTPIGFFGTDSFNYTIVDGSGRTSTATVTVTVTANVNRPLAVDDYVITGVNQPQAIQVLLNDSPGPSPPTRLQAIIAQPGNGMATINLNNSPGDLWDDFIEYTPATDFNGTDQLTYQLVDNNNNISTAVVTIQVGDFASDDKVEYFVSYTDISGNPLTSVPVGDPFYAVMSVRDLRTTPIPSAANDRRGVFAAYVDAIYDKSVLEVQGPIEFPGPHNVATSGSRAVAGFIDEAGGFRNQTDNPATPVPFAMRPFVVFRVPMRAKVVPGGGANGITVIQPDPADLRGIDLPDEDMETSGVHDTIVYQENPTPAGDVGDVELNEIRFTPGPLTITAGAGPEGEHNRITPSDVDNDSAITTLDLVIAVSELILRGSGSVGEGEQAARGSTRYFVDVNNDGLRTSEDVLYIVGDLYRQAYGVRRSEGEGFGAGFGEGEGEGEGEPLFVGVLPGASVNSPTAPPASADPPPAAEQPYASRVDSLLAETVDSVVGDRFTAFPFDSDDFWADDAAADLLAELES